MNFFKIKYLLIVLVLSPTLATAQTAIDTLSWQGFRWQVLGFHPAVRQAALAQSRVEAELMAAKGGFDVKSFADYEEKHFNGKTYFRHLESGLKLPTWYGLEAKLGYNFANGDFINPEAGLPRQGQAMLGLELAALNGFRMDQRRADLKIARIGLGLGELERNLLVNDLSLEAAKSYANWVWADNQIAVIEGALAQARIRHEGVRESFVQGDRPAIDTLETFIQLQTRQIDLTLAQLDYRNALQQMQIFRWDDGASNGQLAIGAQTPAPRLEQIGFLTERTAAPATELVQQALQQHPELGMYRIKGQQLAIEKRLKLEGLKPVLNLNYNILGRGWEFFPTPTENGIGVLANDMKWGINFSMPITNRKARGGVELATLKIVHNELYIKQKQQDIENKVTQYRNELATLGNQLELLRNITNNYRALLDGENTKFGLGESSVFLVNTREQRWLDAQLKYIKTLNEYRKAEAGLVWSMGGFR
jgi:outer membrane protein TolC